MNSLAPRATVSVGSRLLGVGAVAGSTVLTADELGARVGRPGDWIRQRTGIRELRQIGPEQSLAGVALEAARRAGADQQVDAVIVATCSSPVALAPTIAGALAPGAAVVDLNAVCAGFCYAVSVADDMIRSGSARTVLLVAAEQMSSIIDPNDLGTSILFGDGAGAVLLGPAPADELHVGPVVWGSDGALRSMIEIPPGERYMTMAGREVFRWAVETMADVALRACKEAALTVGDIDVFVPHQANLRIIDALATRLGLAEDVVVADDVTISGNTSAASIPLAIAHLLAEGRAHSGQLALTIGFGAGLSYAAQVIRLP